jgi:MOSC domain-containing protein YiiM
MLVHFNLFDSWTYLGYSMVTVRILNSSSREEQQMLPDFHLIKVCVGVQELIGHKADGTAVYSAIRKKPIKTASRMLTATGLVGDEQIQRDDIRDGKPVHGGTEKAVYAYPIEHFPYWEQTLGLHTTLTAGALGENLTIHGLLEADCYVGDVWSIGDVLLRVTKPRQPCYKFNIHMDSPQAGKLMWQSGHCGWYLEVLSSGRYLPRCGQVDVVERIEGAPSIAEVFAQKRQKTGGRIAS